MVNTGFMVVIGVPAGILLGLGCALLLRRPIRGSALYRGAIFVPAVVPSVAVAVIWIWIFNPDYGLLNAALGVVHINPRAGLADPSLSKPSLLMLLVWEAVGPDHGPHAGWPEGDPRRTLRGGVPRRGQAVAPLPLHHPAPHWALSFSTASSSG